MEVLCFLLILRLKVVIPRIEVDNYGIRSETHPSQFAIKPRVLEIEAEFYGIASMNIGLTNIA